MYIIAQEAAVLLGVFFGLSLIQWHRVVSEESTDVFFSPVQGVDCFRCTAPHIHPLTMGDELAERNSSWLAGCVEKISTQP